MAKSVPVRPCALQQAQDEQDAPFEPPFDRAHPTSKLERRRSAAQGHFEWERSAGEKCGVVETDSVHEKVQLHVFAFSTVRIGVYDVAVVRNQSDFSTGSSWRRLGDEQEQLQQSDDGARFSYRCWAR